MERWCLAEECPEVLRLLNLRRQRLRAVACQPADNFVDLLLLAPLPFSFLDIEGIHACKWHLDDAMVVHLLLGMRATASGASCAQGVSRSTTRWVSRDAQELRADD